MSCMTFEQGAADLIRAASSYAWPVVALIIVIVLRDPLGRALAAIAARVSRIGVKTPGGGEIVVDLAQAADLAEGQSSVLGAIQKRLDEINPRQD
jgi:hypothetical protein